MDRTPWGSGVPAGWPGHGHLDAPRARRGAEHPAAEEEAAAWVGSIVVALPTTAY
jgi:hypothetical protein